MEGSIKLVLGGSGYGKTRFVLDKAIEEADKNPDRDYFIVVPEQFTMATQKAITDRHHNHGVINIDIVSFNRLAFRVFEELGISNLSVLDDTGKTLILKRIIDEKRDMLGIYKNKADRPGFVEEMKSAISELYSYGIDLSDFERFAQEAKDKPYTQLKLKDISLVYREFKAALGEKYITKEQILKKLCQVIGKSKLIKNSEFFFDGFTGFTPVQEELLGMLLDAGISLTITVTIPKEELFGITNAGFREIKEQELFNLSKTTINKLYALAAERQISITESDIILPKSDKSYRYSEKEELCRLEKNIFRNRNARIKSEGSVKISVFDNPVREAEAVASYINGRVREKNLRYRDFAVITGDLDTYRKLIETAFKDNDIPFFMDNKRKMILNPCVNAVRQALQIVSEGFSYESVFGFLKCGISGIDREDIDLLENYVLEYGIRGYKAYCGEFTRTGKNFKDEGLFKVNEVREAFISLIGDFKESMSEKKLSVKACTEAVYALMEKLDIYTVLKGYEEEFKSEGKLALSKEYGQTYSLFIGLLDKLVELMGESEIRASEYARLLDSGLEEIKVGVIPLNIDTVVIGDIQRTRLREVKELIVTGVNDGIIPNVSANTGLLSIKDRSLLKEMGAELSPSSRESIFIQRFYLYQNLTKPSERLILTYSRSSSLGKALRPSYLINTVGDMYSDKEMLIGDMREDNEFYNGCNNIYTKELGVRYIAKHFDKKDLFIKELYTYFYKDELYKKKLMKIVSGAGFSAYTGKIDKAVANALYGSDMIKSATRLEKYAACGYAHFIMYGLKLAERKVYEINAADIGTIYHRIIELFSKEMKNEGLSFKEISDENREQLLDKCMTRIEQNTAGDIFFATERNKQLLKRIREVSSKTIWAISEQIKAGSFEPEDFELSFPDGRVDRVDTLLKDGKCYVKITDYKSGEKKFDIDEVMSGLQLQLLYYMGAVLEIEEKKHEGSEVIPAGAFYFTVKSPYVDRISMRYGDDITDEERKRLDELYKTALLLEYRQSGLVNSDRQAAEGMDSSLSEEKAKSLVIPIKSSEIDVGVGKSYMNGRNFNDIVEYVRNKTEEMCGEILDGDIDANPYIKSGRTPCDYCSYREICTFNEKYTGGRYRRLKEYEPQEILNEIKRRTGDNK